MKKFYPILFIFSFLFSYNLNSQVSFTDVGPSMGVNDGGAGQGVVFVDVNNDGYLDIFLINNNTTNKLWINNSGTAFTESLSSWGIISVVPGRGLSCGDYNNDGYVDVMIGNWQSTILLYKNLGTSFTEVGAAAGVNFTGYGGAINWLDFDQDGKLDAVFCNNGVPARFSYVFKNNDLQTFSHVTFTCGMTDSTSVLACASGDYDNDGDLDVFWGTQMSQGIPGTGVLYQNNGNGTFTNVTTTSSLITTFYSWGVHWGDYNNDGHLDMAIANSNGPSQVYKNNGNGTFTEVTFTLGINVPTSAYSCGWADYDNDGDLDIYFSRGQNNEDKLYRNDGATFTDVTTSVGMGDLLHSSCISWGDFNNDGFLDLYLNNNGTPNRLYKNNAGNSNKWVIFRCQGTTSNKSAIGTRVTVKTGSLTQIREVEGGSGGKGQNSLPVEFGLGSATIIDSLIIRWQSGLTQRFANIVPNRIIDVVEGQPVSSETGITVLPKEFRLEQNYPNPFNSSTAIRFELPVPGYAKIAVYNHLGKEVAVINEGILNAGTYNAYWNADAYSSGIYYYKLTSGKFSDTKKMVLVK